MSEPMERLSVEITARNGTCQISPMEIRFALHYYKT
jgi:hypothetical protein